MFQPELKEFDQDLYFPDHKTSITSLFPLAIRLLDIQETKKDLILSNPSRLSTKLTKIITSSTFKHCIIWLVDGIGTEINQISWMKALINKHGGWLSSVFPTTTSSAVTSILTGVTPARHGILGTKTFIPEIGSTLNLLTLRTERAKFNIPVYDAGIKPTNWLWKRPLHEFLHDKVQFYHLIMSHLVNSGFSKIIYPDDDVNIGYWVPHDGIERMRLILENNDEASSENKMLIFYTNLLDSVSHHFTKESSLHGVILEMMKEAWITMLSRFNSRTLENTLLILASDHGQIVPSPKEVVEFDEQTWQSLLEITGHRISFSGRTLHFHVPNEKQSDVLKQLEKIVENNGIIKTTDDLKEILDNDPSSLDLQAIEQRMGNVHVLLRENATFSFPTHSSRKSTSNKNIIQDQFRTFLSTHGSLTRDELLTPFFAISLGGFLDTLQRT